MQLPAAEYRHRKAENCICQHFIAGARKKTFASTVFDLTKMPIFAILFTQPKNAIFSRRKNMKSLGIIRKLDNAGRFVMPISLRRTLGLDKCDGAVEIFVDGDTVMLRRYSPTCIFCKSENDVIEFADTIVCKACAKKLGELAE